MGSRNSRHRPAVEEASSQPHAHTVNVGHIQYPAFRQRLVVRRIVFLHFQSSLQVLVDNAGLVGLPSVSSPSLVSRACKLKNELGAELA